MVSRNSRPEVSPLGKVDLLSFQSEASSLHPQRSASNSESKEVRAELQAYHKTLAHPHHLITAWGVIPVFLVCLI